MTRRSASLALWAAGTVVLGCTEKPPNQTLPSLERSSAASYVCLAPGGAGRDIDSCPDYDANDNEQRYIYALVTQTGRGEVAAINLNLALPVDENPSVPGYEFLPVAAFPVDIVSTPGGVASFVTVREDPNKNGIFALPSTCISPPSASELPRDLTSYPACALQAAPGRMMLLIDPPDSAGRLRPACSAPYDDVTGIPGLEPEVNRATICPGADLGQEKVAHGRRKLLVSIPDLGGLALIDAQWLLNQPPGSFDPCQVEEWIPLQVEVDESVSQPVPPDLQPPAGSGPECGPATLNYGPIPGTFRPQPNQMARADDLVLVTDLGAPVVHRLRVGDPCTITEDPPLLPKSFEQPGRTDFETDAIAVGPATTTGQRFAYVVDGGKFGSGALMVFDLSSSDRTPLIRPDSARSPFEPADRIAFSSPVRAVEMVLHDVPNIDPTTGLAPIGQHCDPNPDVDPSSLGASYRQSADRKTGANPSKLRGVFGLAALASGQIAVIDVEDFDAPCRRPIRANPNGVPNFQGCADDPVSGFYTAGGTATGQRTVTDEASCQMVEPHRPRAGFAMLSSAQTGVHAPSLRTFPRLRSSTAATLPTDQSTQGVKNPKVLAVNYDPATPAQVYVGTNLYQAELPGGPAVTPSSLLPTDPTTASNNSLSFWLQEPRAFPSGEDVSLTYEGPVTPERPAGFLRVSGTGSNNQLADDSGGFCSRGVEDFALARQRGSDLGVPGDALDAFARLHADYLQITADLPAEDDTYWSNPQSVGYTCGSLGNGNGYAACLQVFGNRTTPSDTRDFVILEAYENHVVVEPRAGSDIVGALALAYCCFGAGQATSYRVRAGDQWVLTGSVTGFLHDVVAGSGPDFRCRRGCNPRRARFKSRALEVVTVANGHVPTTCTGDDSDAPDCCLPGQCLIDCRQEDGRGVVTDSPCVLNNLTTRLAVYRGQARSQRDMAFGWQYSGGFTPLNINLLTETSAVLPEWMRYVPQIGQLSVADGSSEGLAVVSLEALTVSHFFR
jgi:hypothetical protein